MSNQRAAHAASRSRAVIAAINALATDKFIHAATLLRSPSKPMKVKLRRSSPSALAA